MLINGLPEDAIGRRYLAVCTVYGCTKEIATSEKYDVKPIISKHHNYICDNIYESGYDVLIKFHDEENPETYIVLNMVQYLYSMLAYDELNDMKTAVFIESTNSYFDKGKEYHYRFYGNDSIQVFDKENNPILISVDEFSDVFKVHPTGRIGKCLCYCDYSIGETIIFHKNDVAIFEFRVNDDETTNIGIYLPNETFYKMEENDFNDHFILFDEITKPTNVFCILDYGYPVTVYSDTVDFESGIWCNKSAYYQMRVYNYNGNRSISVISDQHQSYHMISRELVPRFFLTV